MSDSKKVVNLAYDMKNLAKRSGLDLPEVMTAFSVLAEFSIAYYAEKFHDKDERDDFIEQYLSNMLSPL